MSTVVEPLLHSETSVASGEALFDESLRAHHRQIDVRFGWLMLLQWALGIGLAAWWSPFAWNGTDRAIHPHLWAAIILGGLFNGVPAWAAWTRPGRASTRQLVAAGQTLTSALWIHLAGGRLEFHFHVFGSLAILAGYRDYRVLLTASAITAADHFVRGLFAPQSIYGEPNPDAWRWLEHAAWVVVEDLFLIQYCRQSLREMRTIADERAKLEGTNARIGKLVEERTAELLATEAQMRALFESAVDAVVIWDASGRLLQANRSACEMFGARVRADGASLFDLFEPDGAAAMRELLEDHVAGRNDHLLGRRDSSGLGEFGDAFPVTVAINDIRTAAGPRFAGVFRDNTETKIFQSALRNQIEQLNQARLVNEEQAREQQRLLDELEIARARAESASRSKSDFLAAMSHEIRTPINGILGMTDLALETELTAEQLDYLKTVRSSSEALLAIINDILDLSKIEAGKLELHPVDFSLRPGLAAMIQPLAARAQAKRVELTCRVAPDLPDDLHGDDLRLRQVLINLIGNAIKFTPEKGRIEVDCRVVERTETQLLAEFSVRDSGIGIPEDMQKRVFDAFDQAGAATARQYGGTGLGLNISNRLVGLMGGRLSMQSRPGEGSTFRFTAPLGVGSPSDGGSRPRPAAPPETRMLVFDRSEASGDLTCEILRTWGFDPMSFTSAESAAAALQALSPRERGECVLVASPGLGFDGAAPASDPAFQLVREAQDSPAPVRGAVLLVPQGVRVPRGLLPAPETCAIVPRPAFETPLRMAIESALGTSAADGEVRKEVGAGRRSYGGLRVLVADDNPVNRKLASTLLNRRGFEVVLANDGAEATRAVLERRFDIVLMDVQMPVLNGVAATEEIRKREAATGDHLPIVAVTACALKGDRERFLAAGMDAFVSKPLLQPELFATIDEMLARFPQRSENEEAARASSNRRADGPVPSEPAPFAEPASSGGAVVEESPAGSIGAADGRAEYRWIDADKVRSRCCDDVELMDELIGMFLPETARLLNELERAVESGAAPAVNRLAHAIKGSIGEFTLGEPHRVAQRLEHDAADGNLTNAAMTVARLRALYSELADDLERLRRSLTAAVATA